MANQYQGYRHIHEEIRAQPHRLVLPVKQAEVEDCKGEGHDGLFIFSGQQYCQLIFLRPDCLFFSSRERVPMFSHSP